jgi:hypothetical protein
MINPPPIPHPGIFTDVRIIYPCRVFVKSVSIKKPRLQSGEAQRLPHDTQPGFSFGTDNELDVPSIIRMEQLRTVSEKRR